MSLKVSLLRTRFGLGGVVLDELRLDVPGVVEEDGGVVVPDVLGVVVPEVEGVVEVFVVGVVLVLVPDAGWAGWLVSIVAAAGAASVTVATVLSRTLIQSCLLLGSALPNTPIDLIAFS